jgi:UDP-N-acetylglucosamine 2-epimerase (non-hydrolysing)
VALIAGARPNFVKIAPLWRAFKKADDFFATTLVHTGQHYDDKMSAVFFRELDIPKPKINLNVGSGSHARQTADIMIKFEEYCLKHQPDLVVVVGDVNSTIACALVAKKLKLALAHVEAGLRSFDLDMPEEINRLATDALSDYLFASEGAGVQNLKKEGVNKQRLFFVGNVMIDSLREQMPRINKSKILKKLRIAPKTYAVVTVHRASNVDHRSTLLKIFNLFDRLAAYMTIVYPAHPRSVAMMKRFGLWERFNSIAGLKIIEPLGYLDFNKLVKESSMVLTDSGGIQEETTVMAIPCLTMRQNTERPVTITQGTNVLVGQDEEKIFKNIKRIMEQRPKKAVIPKFWDGHTAPRIVQILKREFQH